jgi:hypothetical protein
MGNSPTGQASAGVGVVDVISFLVFLLAILGLIQGVIFLKTAEYVVTDRRVVGKYGMIRAHSVDVMMSQIAGISESFTVLGRIFRYGNVVVNGSGTRQTLVWVKDPTAFRVAVYQQLESSRLLRGTAAYTLDVRMAPDDRAPSSLVPPATSAAATLFCTQCGRGLPSNARFCAYCSASATS